MRRSVLQMWKEANEQVQTITAKQLTEEMESGDVILLDVRLPAELSRRGTVRGAVLVPRQVIEWWADPESPYFRPEGVFGDFSARIVTMCDGGGNGAFAALTLQELGYTNVATVEGGFFGWLGAGLPTVQ